MVQPSDMTEEEFYKAGEVAEAVSENEEAFPPGEEILIMGYTVQPQALESTNGMYNILFVNYDFRFQHEVDRGLLDWLPFQQDVRINIPKRATDEEISALIADDMIRREQQLRGYIENADADYFVESEDKEKPIDNPSGLVGKRITGEK